MDKALFIDRDGVINQDNGYTFKVSDLQILDGVIEGLKAIQDLNYKIFIITNQSGIARGFFTLLDLQLFMKTLIMFLEDSDIFIKDYFYCPHHIKGVLAEYTKLCECRKPRPGMIMQAKEKYNLDLSRSVLIGDKESDILAGKEAKLLTNILITNKPLSNDSMASAGASDLIKAAKIIQQLN
tara:strand:+ start:11307 stop:11852 length:546 start_codon:yes stop_codon:yes gene_type:complete